MTQALSVSVLPHSFTHVVHAAEDSLPQRLQKRGHLLVGAAAQGVGDGVAGRLAHPELGVGHPFQQRLHNALEIVLQCLAGQHVCARIVYREGALLKLAVAALCCVRLLCAVCVCVAVCACADVCVCVYADVCLGVACECLYGSVFVWSVV